MNSYRMASVCLLLMCLALDLTVVEQPARAQNAPNKYRVNITVTIANPNGQPRIVTLPAATIPQGNAQTLKFEVGKESFQFDVAVKPNAAQKLVAKTSGRLKIDGKQVTTPTLEQPIGTPAEIEVAGIAVKVTYAPMK